MHVDQEKKKKAIRRAKIIEGQIKALRVGIENETYCVDLLIQLRAIQNSLKGLGRVILQNHISSHVKQMLHTKVTGEKAVDELVTLLELSDKYN
jgi:CsoR family transcriptional regulator, copper-sensing transcriptional repressor